MIIGFGAALLSMILFGLYMVPRKCCALKDFEFVLSMGFGVALTMLTIWLIVHAGRPVYLPSGAVLTSFCCGPIWAMGMTFYTLAVARIGLTLATPIKNTTAILGTLAGLLFFNEAQHTQPALALTGSVLIVLCAVIIGRSGESSEIHYSANAPGIAYSLLAAVCFAAYAAPLKHALLQGLDSYSTVMFMSLGTLASAIIGQKVFGGSFKHWALQPMSAHLWGGLSGSIWTLATLTMNVAIMRIGLAVTWPITNLNTIVTVFFGAWVFHEIPIQKRWKQLTWGFLFATAGVILLGLSKH